MREFVTTLLDSVGLMLLAAGAIGGMWSVVGPWALAFGGCVVLAGSWGASRIEARGDDS